MLYNVLYIEKVMICMIWAFDNKFYKLLDLIINSDISLLDSFQNSEVVNKKFKMLLVVEYIQSEIIDITLRNKTAINRIELSYNHREDDFHLFLMDNNKFCFNMNSIARINGDEVSLKYLKNINGVEKSLKNRINKETYCCLKDLLQHVNE